MTDRDKYLDHHSMRAMALGTSLASLLIPIRQPDNRVVEQSSTLSQDKQAKNKAQKKARRRNRK